MFKKIAYFATAISLGTFLACGSYLNETRNGIKRVKDRLTDLYVDERNDQRKLYHDGKFVYFEGEARKPADGKLDFSCTGHFDQPDYRCTFIIEEAEQIPHEQIDWIQHAVRDSPEGMRLQSEFDQVKISFDKGGK